jgi:chondroitin AC lyase
MKLQNCFSAFLTLSLAAPALATDASLSLARPVAPAVDLRTRIALIERDAVTLNPAGDAADQRTVKQRLRQLYLVEQAPAATEVAAWLAALQPDGSWAEYDYATFHTQFFPPFAHLRRVGGMALAYLQDTPLRGDPQLLDAVARAIRFWVGANPQTHHLWFVEIGVPIFLAKPLVLLEEELDPALVQRAIPLLTRAVTGDDYVYNGAPATGANLTWIARAALEAALLVGDIPLAVQASRRLADEIRVTRDEGIQPDFGFYQHGKQFYAGGYGASFIHDCATIAALLDGTRFALDPNHLALLVDYILEGPRWMTRHGQWVSGSRGREIARPGGRMGGGAVRRLLAVADLPRRHELEAFLAELDASRGAQPPSIHGNRHFWSVDLMAHHTPSWSVFIDLSSKRIFGTEGGNRENLLGYHLVDGVVEIMRRGDEYHNIAPLWDWKKLPGTTIRQYPADIPLIDWWGDGTRGTTAFTGGLSDGQRGLAVLDFDRHGVRTRKAWAVTDAWLLATGTTPRVDPANSDPVITTIDQRRRRGPVIIEQPGHPPQTAVDGDTPLVGPVWVRHDGMAWLIPDGQLCVLRLDSRRESWRRVNQAAGGDDRSEEGDIMSLWLDHGVSPVSNFHYIVWPDLPLGAPLIADHLWPRHQWLNDELLVVDDPVSGSIQIAAFAASEWQLDDGVLAVSAPCLLQADRIGDGLLLSAADPAQLRSHIAVRLPGGWLPDSLRHLAATPLSVDLPVGAHAGNSVRLHLTPDIQPPSATASPHAPLISLAGGIFQMGSAGGDTDELPVHSVVLHPFDFGTREVSFAEWRAVRDWGLLNGYSIPSLGAPHHAVATANPDNAPVVRVTWFSAVLWCNALSELHGLEPVYYSDVNHRHVLRAGEAHLSPSHVKWSANGYRLPTEAEWEFAARSGNPLITGLSGAVSEWCFDWYGGYPAEPQLNPTGPLSGFDRARRGGIKGGLAGGRQSPSLRLSEAPGAGAGNIGLRVVRCANNEHR